MQMVRRNDTLAGRDEATLTIAAIDEWLSGV
jgi:hypothetical protein